MRYNKLTMLIIIGTLLLSNIAIVSAYRTNEATEIYGQDNDTQENVVKIYFLAQIESIGTGFCGEENQNMINIMYLDENAVTTIKPLFRRKPIEITGCHELTIMFPSKFKLKDLSYSSYGDINLECMGVIVKIEIIPNNNPTANDDYVTIAKNSIDSQIDVLENDLDVDSDPIMIVYAQSSNMGSVVAYSEFLFYTPDEDFTGQDQITYIISDNKGYTDSATVYIDVV